ncbi:MULTISPECIES: citryl-CoA lyase [unclassified Bradyrhizobium]|uniref:citryl-CoA lyase n=1 Tax=unclassified Bradyrhizobium TaxID=2631580 RepID=UPI001BCD42B1|nr:MULTISPECIES: citryl-CoA lyase [unclassified Bradyrhizobium]MBT1516383.1 citryl-CoA lyase [Bradyrhizobium sp. SRL28]WOH52155.1 citryl-CoA lyase [Bradyrhizobium sp. sBnM-33]
MSETELREQAAHWWRTSICDIAPGRIAYRGYTIEELIGHISFTAIIWLMLRGELPTPAQERLLQAALVASVDHGPHAPSIAIAQMAVSCGVPLNGAMASAINTLDDLHGGAGEQAIELYDEVLRRSETKDIDEAAAEAIDHFTATRSKYLPGFGHRFHPVDPRVDPLLALVDAAVSGDVVSGCYASAARAIERVMRERKGKLIPMNIDGATAVVYGELGFAAPLARGIFCLSRAVGILAHAWEQTGRKDRNKGPMPKQFAYKYQGQPKRSLKEAP